MRKVLYILGQLDDQDVDWMARAGRRVVLQPGETLITQGEATPDLYIVIDGSLVVSARGVGKLATLLSGEIVGEMSFVDSSPPSASVAAESSTVVLAIPKDDIEEKIQDEPMFGLRFFRALALFLADRLRNTTKSRAQSSKGSLSETEVDADELDEKLMDKLAVAGDRFDRLTKAVSAKRS